MIIYEREKKTIIIPSGMGGNGDCSDAIAAARAAGIAAGKQAQEAIDNAKLTPSITITDNGEYRANYGYQSVFVNVEGGQGCQGVYDEGYADGYQEGYAEGAGSQGCQGVYDEGYAVGYQGGYDEGYAEGIQGCQGCQGVYDEGYSDGYSAGETAGQAEGYQSGYQGGFSDGETAQKNKLTSTAITTNGTFTRQDGWSSVTVNVSGATPRLEEKIYYLTSNYVGQDTLLPSEGYQGFSMVHIYDNGYGTLNYNQGYDAGEAAQKNKLSSTAITQNGTYTKNDGWSAVTVNVQGGDCKLEILAKSSMDTHIGSASVISLCAQETRDFTINGNPIAEFNPKMAGGKNFKSENWDFRSFYTPYVETIRSISFTCYYMEHSQDVAANETLYGNYRFYLQWGGVTLTPISVTSALSGTYSELCTYTATFSNNGALADAIYAAGQSVTGGTFTGTFITSGTSQMWDIIGPIPSDFNYVKLDGTWLTTGSTIPAAGTHSIEIEVGVDEFNTQVTPHFFAGVEWTAMDFDF